MAKRSTKTQRAAELSRRGLVARRCGERMAASGLADGVAWRVMMADEATLTDCEKAARATLMPATWMACWHAGFRAGREEVDHAE